MESPATNASDIQISQSSQLSLKVENINPHKEKKRRNMLSKQTMFTTKEFGFWIGAAFLHEVKSLKRSLEYTQLYDRRRKIICFNSLHRIPTSHVNELFPKCAAVLPVMQKLNNEDIQPPLYLNSKGLITVQPQDPLKHIQIACNELSVESITCIPTLKLSNHCNTIQNKFVELVAKYNSLFEKETNESSLSFKQMVIPTKWERLGDIVLFPNHSFHNIDYPVFWKDVAEIMQCRGIGFSGYVTGEKRESQCRMIYGGSGIVEHKENGVIYVLDVTQCMFSSGNGTERQRIATTLQQVHTNPYFCLLQPYEVFVDMYCGIGYFTLGVLVKCPNVKEVWACDWNLNALNFFQEGTKLNKIKNLEDRLHVLYGDSRTLGLPSGLDLGRLKGKATRISLGLIPSSEEGWDAAVRIMNPNGALLHVHGLGIHRHDNDKAGRNEFGKKVLEDFNERIIKQWGGTWAIRIQHIEKVKSYSPNVYHLVVDLFCRQLKHQ